MVSSPSAWRRVVCIVSRPTKFIVSCEHAGNVIPGRWGSYFRKAGTALRSHRGWDPGAFDVAVSLSQAINAPLFATHVSRLLIDNNRSLTNPAVWSQYSKLIPAGERAEIVDEYYLPHRGEIERAVAASLGDNDVFHLGVHSFTPELNGVVRDCDFSLLYDPKVSSEREFCRDWLSAIKVRNPTWRLRKNYPYRGSADGLTTALRGVFPEGRYCGIELEFNHGLLANRKQWRLLVSNVMESLVVMIDSR